MGYRNIRIYENVALLGIVYIFLISPLIYFASRQYIAIYPDHIADNTFFSTSERVIKLSDVRDVTFYTEHNKKGNSIAVRAAIFLVNEPLIDEVIKEPLKLKNTLQQLNVKVILNKPSDYDLGIAQRICGEHKLLKEVFEIEELNPIEPVSCL